MKIKLLIAFCLVNSFSQAQVFSEIQKIIASDRGSGDEFGYSVSISGNYAIVGARWDDEDENGVNTIAETGSAYIFEKNQQGTWVQVQKIVASDRGFNGSYYAGFNDYFGEAVCIEGNYAFVGANWDDEDENGLNYLSNVGSAYIFERDSTGNWNEIQKIVASDRGSGGNHFGTDLKASGNYLVVGSDNNAAYVFTKDANGTWYETQKIISSDVISGDYFGSSVSISNNYIVAGAYGEDEDENGFNYFGSSGSVYVFEKDVNGTFNQVQKIVASDRGFQDEFGWDVDIDGNTLLIGARTEERNVIGTDSINKAGAAYFFERDGNGNWIETQKVVASNRNLEDFFGHAVELSGDYAVIGAFYHSILLNPPYTGTAYIFNRNSLGNWNETQEILSSDIESNDIFGWDVALDANVVLIGALGECHDTSSTNFLQNSGSAYFFEGCLPTYTSISPVACDSFTSPSGNILTTSNIYVDTLSNVNGCDSIITINLTINNSNSGSENITACDSYNWAANGTTYTNSGTYTAILTNASGCDSIANLYLTINNSTSGGEGVTVCDSYTWNANGTTYTNSGTYTATLPNANGCDSVATLYLTIVSIDTSVTESFPTLSSNENTLSSTTYQWIDCNSGLPISGATSPMFNPVEDGAFSVEISAAGCVDTSACHIIQGIGVPEMLSEYIAVYPNPNNGSFLVDLNNSYEKIEFELFDISGRLVYSASFNNSDKISCETNQSTGVYFLQIILDNSKVKPIRVVMQ